LEAVFILLEPLSPSRRIFIGSHSLPPIWFAVSVLHINNCIDPDPNITRFLCNPIRGELFYLLDIDNTKRTMSCILICLLTRFALGHGPPDRYVVAALLKDHDGKEPSFIMRRFFSQTGEWDKQVGLPSPLPLERRICIHTHHEVLAFAGRLWWVDLSWGAISAYPFSY
jgi:hypothetical protein